MDTGMDGEKSLLLKMLGSSPELRIIDFFLDNKLFDFSKKEIIEGTGMSKATFYKHWEQLESFGIVKVSRSFGKARLFQLNRGNPLVEKLFEVEKQLVRLAAQRRGTAVRA